MTSGASTPRPEVRRNLPRAFGLLAIVPALLLAGFGFYSLRREKDLALVDARNAAQEQGWRLGEAVMEEFGRLGLPSRAEVEAAMVTPARPESGVLERVQRGEMLRFFAEGFSYPPNPGSQALPRAFDPVQLPGDLASEWRELVALDQIPGRATEAIARWGRLLEQTAGMAGEENVRFRLGRALVAAGRTREARPVLEAVFKGGVSVGGETGLPLDYLAARSLLQAAEVDAGVARDAERWLHRIADRVLIRGQLPEVLLTDWEPVNPALVASWRAVARHHEAIREAIPALPEVMTTKWAVREGGAWLRMLQPVEGGVWVMLLPESAVSNLVTHPLRVQTLPPGIEARVVLGGREFAVGNGGDAGETLASVPLPGLGDPFSVVRVTLPDLEAFHARTRTRTWVFAGFIALAGGVSVAAMLAMLRATERERRLAMQQSDFVASVSHELRAPLAAVRLMVEELTDLPPTALERRAEYHRLILRETQRLGLLVENVLRHARLERSGDAVDRSRVDLREVVERSVESLRPCADDRGLVLESVLPAVPVWADIDPLALQQVVVNLLDNALKHSPAGATVRVGVSVEDAEVRPGIPSAYGGLARVWVADHGAGIPKAEQEKIFESFYRRGTELRRETAGVGLGLALVKRIVEAHEGRVSVESRPGAGARFTVEIPRSFIR